MPHQVFDTLDRHIPICQVCPEGMPEHVRVNVADPRALGVGLHGRPHGLATEALPVAEVAKDVFRIRKLTGLQPLAEDVLHLEVHRNDALFTALVRKAKARCVR